MLEIYSSSNYTKLLLFTGLNDNPIDDWTDDYYGYYNDYEETYYSNYYYYYYLDGNDINP